MKRRFLTWCLISTVALAGLSCKDKPKSPESEKTGDKSVVEKASEAVKEAVAPEPTSSLNAEERAAKLGFVKYLPKDTEMVMSFYNAEQSVEQIKALKLYGIIEKNLGKADVRQMQDGLPEDEQAVDDADADNAFPEPPADDAVMPEGEMGESSSPWILLGREVTVALGDTGGEQTGNLRKLKHRSGYFYAKVFGQAAQEYAKTGKMEDFETMWMSQVGGAGLIKALLEDPEAGTALLENAEMPPLYIAFRSKEDETEQAAQIVNSAMESISTAEEIIEPIEFETAGATFSGYKILGKKLADTMEKDRASMEKDFESGTVDAIIYALEKKNLIVVTGTVGEYIVVILGGDESKMLLAGDVKDSLVATDNLRYADPFADKQLLSIIHGKKELWDELTEVGGDLAPYVTGLRDGISGGGGLGDTRDLQAMLQIIADRETEVLALGSSSDLGVIAYVEDGVKIESFGGHDDGSIDWKAENSLSHLGESGENFLFMNATSNAAYDEKLGEYVEAIFETAYAMTVKFSSLELETPEFAKMKEFTQLIDEKFRNDVVGVFEALTGDFADGLGQESAIVIDLNGAVPAVPGIPQEIIDHGRAPRISMIAPVTDRKKLSAAWDEMNKRSTSILAVISEMVGKNIPMKKPMSSESNGMTTWFVPFDFVQDDFVPSVTLNDRWFAASTSKTQSIALINKAEAGGQKGEGLQFYVNFTALADYADEMLAMADKNSADLFTEQSVVADFNLKKVEIQEVIDACREFDSLKWIAREENGYIRNTIHFKTK